MRWCALVGLGGLLLLGLPGGLTDSPMLNQCSDLKAQNDVDLKEVMGKWYVVEVIEHRNPRLAPTAETGGGGSGNFGTVRRQIDTCPLIYLKSMETPGGPPRISLLWQESAGELEYTFWVSNSQGKGVWNCDYSQNGTLTQNPNYKQFIGTVHVTKAVASHVVLTFCARSNDGQKFSVLMGREHKLSSNDLNGVHKLLNRRELKLLSIRESCANAATRTLAASLVLLLGSTLARQLAA